MPKLTPARLLVALLLIAVVTFALNPPALLVQSLMAVLFFLIARSIPLPARVVMVAVMVWMAFRLWDIGVCHDAGGQYVGNLVTPRCDGATLPPRAELGEGVWGLVACTAAVALAVVEGAARCVRNRQGRAA